MTFYLDYERLSHHKSMISDKKRTKSFKKAINKKLSEGETVADIGAGLGILSFFSDQAGARKIYSIERTGIINLAKRIAKQNKINNISWINKDSKEANLTEKIDLIISECIGYFALQENMLSDVIDFRERFLKENGKVIPSSIELHLAPVNSEESYQEIKFWDDVEGMDFTPAREVSFNSVYQKNLREKDLLSSPHKIKTIDLEEDREINLNISETFEIEERDVLHGFCGYFKANLTEEISLSNKPGNKTHWKTQFFPLKKPIEVEEKTDIGVTVKADLQENYVDWRWKLENSELDYEHSTKKGIQLKEF